MADGGGGFFRGTSTEQDARFGNKMKKLMKTMKFAPNLEEKVDMSKVNLDTIKPWVVNRVTSFLGFEDDVVTEFVFNLLENEKQPDPKEMQINLTGFLHGKNARIFMQELWDLLLSAQDNIGGIPSVFLEKKMAEIKQQKEEHDRIAANLESRLRQTKPEAGVGITNALSAERNTAGASSEYLAAEQDQDREVVAVKVKNEPLTGEENGAQLPAREESGSLGNHAPATKGKESMEQQISKRSALPSPSRGSESRDKRRSRSPSRSPGHRSHSLRQRSSSPRRHSRSPRRHSRSPRRHSRSPRRSSRSPRRHSRSPRRHSRSPRRSSRSPRRSPRRHSRSPRRHSRSPKRHSRSPKRLSRSPRRPSRSPRRHSRSPRRHSRSPRRLSHSPSEHSCSPKQPSRSPKQCSRSPRQQSRSPRRSSRSPRRHSRSPRRHSRSPRQLSPSPRRRSHSPKRRSRSPRGHLPSSKWHTRSARQHRHSPRRYSRFTGSPKRRSRSPRRRYKSPRQRSASPRHNSLSPRRAPRLPKRYSPLPRRYSRSPRQRFGSPRRRSPNRFGARRDGSYRQISSRRSPSSSPVRPWRGYSPRRQAGRSPPRSAKVPARLRSPVPPRGRLGSRSPYRSDRFAKQQGRRRHSPAMDESRAYRGCRTPPHKRKQVDESDSSQSSSVVSERSRSVSSAEGGSLIHSSVSPSDGEHFSASHSTSASPSRSPSLDRRRALASPSPQSKYSSSREGGSTSPLQSADPVRSPSSSPQVRKRKQQRDRRRTPSPSPSPVHSLSPRHQEDSASASEYSSDEAPKRPVSPVKKSRKRHRRSISSEDKDRRSSKKKRKKEKKHKKSKKRRHRKDSDSSGDSSSLERKLRDRALESLKKKRVHRDTHY